LIGCSRQKKQLEASEYDTVNNLDGVHFIALENTVSPKGLTTLFENKTNTEFTFGEAYVLEVNIDGNWYKVPIETEDNYGFIDIGYILPPNDTAEWSVEWDWLYGDLESGKYRIIKDVLDVYEAGGYDAYPLAAEFEIE
jgi:hypothetical protein